MAGTCPGSGTSTSIRCATPAWTEVSGVRAQDMGLRLFYEDVPMGRVDTDLIASLHRFIAADPIRPSASSAPTPPCWRIRRELAKITEVEVVS